MKGRKTRNLRKDRHTGVDVGRVVELFREHSHQEAIPRVVIEETLTRIPWLSALIALSWSSDKSKSVEAKFCSRRPWLLLLGITAIPR